MAVATDQSGSSYMCQSQEDSFDAFWQADREICWTEEERKLQQKRTPPIRMEPTGNGTEEFPSTSAASSPHNDSDKSVLSTSKSPPAKRARHYQIRQRASASRVQPNESGVPGFPVLINHTEHVLLRVREVQKEFSHSLGAVLRLHGELIGRNRKMVNVTLRDSWAEMPVRRGNSLRLVDAKQKEERCLEVSDSAGLALLEPETLISSTQLSQALYCPRKALFSDRFRASGSTLAMTVGIVAHELFQSALLQLPTDLSADWLFRLYRRRFLATICLDLVAMECSLERFEEELRPYLGNIANWIQSHIPLHSSVLPQKPFAKLRHLSVNSELSMAEESAPEPVFYAQTRDIEENVWTPTLGAKGRIDVSFVSSSQPQNGQSSKAHSKHRPLVMPLELKTGKCYGSSGSIEHQSQVLLYSLMLSERANEGRIGPGLILYLKDNTVVDVNPRTLQLRGLLQMRNRLAAHFSRFTLNSFPEPLNEPRSCSLCPYSTLCGVLKNEENGVTPSDEIVCIDSESDKENEAPHIFGESRKLLSAEMRTFMSTSTAHLCEADIAYAEKWIRRIMAEWDSANQKGSTKRLFSQIAHEREAGGYCLANMELVESRKHSEDCDRNSESYLLLFRRKEGGFPFPPKCQLEPGSIVTVSTERAYALLMSTVFEIDGSSRTVKLISDKELPRDTFNFEHASSLTFNLDKHEGFSTHAFRLGTICALLENNEQTASLRRILTAGSAKTHNPNVEQVITLDEYGIEVQQMPILRAVDTPDYAIARASSKKESSLALATLAKSLLRSGRSVLLCANSNAGVDELLLRIIEKNTNANEAAQFLRIGTRRAVHPSLRHLLLEQRLQQNGADNSSEDGAAKALYSRARALVHDSSLVATTVHSVASHSFFASARLFDFCLLDDSVADLSESALLAPLLRARRFVLFGCSKNGSDERRAPKSDSEVPLLERLANMNPSKVFALDANAGTRTTEGRKEKGEKRKGESGKTKQKTLLDFWKKRSG